MRRDAAWHVAVLGGAAGALLGILALVGWGLKLPLLASFRSAYKPIAPTAACVLILLGLLLVRLSLGPLSKRVQVAAAVVTGFVSLYGLLEIIEFLVGADLNGEEALTAYLGRALSIPSAPMSPAAGALMFLVGVALLALELRPTTEGESRGRRFGDAAGVLGAVAATSAMVFVLGYAYGAPLLYRTRVIPIAATSALGFLFLAIGTVAAAGPAQWPLRALAGTSVRAQLLRTFIPLTVVAVIAVSVAGELVPTFLNINHALQLAILAVAFAVIVGLAVSRAAERLSAAIERAQAAQRGAEEARRESEELLALFIEHAPAAIAMFDMQMRYLSYSRRWLTDYHLVGQELRGRSHYEVFPEIPERWKEVHQRCLAGAVERTEEDPFLRADGRLQWLRWEVRPWYRASGEIGGIVMLTEDITERKRQQEEFAQTAHRLQWLMDALPVGVAVAHDPECREVTFNPMGAGMFGVETQENVSLSAAKAPRREFPHYRDGRRLGPEELPLQRAVAEDREVRGFEAEIELPDGRRRVIRTDAAPVHDLENRVVGGIAVVADITEQRRLLEIERARAHEARLRTIALAYTTTGVAFLAPDFTFLEMNSAFAQHLRVRREELLGRNYVEVLPHPGVHRLFESVRDSGEPLTVEEFAYQAVLHPERGVTYWNASLVPVKDEMGALYGFVFSLQEVTEQVRARERIAEAEAERARQAQLLETILDNVQSGVAYLDRELRHVLVNPMYESLVQHTREELIGRRLLDLYDLPEIEAFYAHVRDTGEPFRKEEYPLQIPGYPERGVTYWNGAVAPLKNGTGYVYGLVLSLTDVTGQVRLREQMLAAERARTQLAEQLGREISHRVKNNLAMVVSMLQMQMGRLGVAEPARVLMRDAISRIRTFAVLYEQTYQRQTEDVELVDALRRIAEIDRAALTGGEVTVSVVGEPVSYRFESATNLLVAVNELITNAMKYGAPDATGEVRVEVEVARRNGTLLISVWNSGNPITPDFGPAEIARGGLSLVTGIADYYQGSLTMRPHRGGTLAEVVISEDRLRGERGIEPPGTGPAEASPCA